MTEPRSTVAARPAPSFAVNALRAVLLVVAGTALLTLSAKFQVPFWPVPMTLQTLVVLLIGATYGWKLGAATILAYIAEGMMGFPVFAGTPPAVAGPAYLLGPTAGFIFSWVIVAALVGYAADKGARTSPVKLGGAMLLGVFLQFAIGFAWLAWFAQLSNGHVGLGINSAFMGAVAPFLLGDAIKVALAALLVPAGTKLLGSVR